MLEYRTHLASLLCCLLAAVACAGPSNSSPNDDAPMAVAIDAPAVPATAEAAAETVSAEKKKPPSVPPPKEKDSLALLPFMNIEQESIDTVVGAIERTYGWDVVVMDRHELPKSAWYKPKKRYRAEILLDWLNTKIPEGADRIMGLTRKDISTTKGDIHDWGICGLAEAPGTASMVSTYRIKKKMGKLTAAERKAKYIQRLEDLSTHEFGHTLGLPHCPNTGCVMEDAKGTVKTFDHSTGKLCDECVEMLAKWGYSLPSG